MTSAYSINLNFNNTIPIKTDFTFKQGDKGITLNLATAGLDPTGTTAHIVFKRSNGTSVEAELTGQTGPSYSYTILGNEFEIPGVVVADLKLYNGDTQRVSTASFIFLVTGDTMDGVGGGTGGYSDQLEQLSQEFAETLTQYEEAFADVGAVHAAGNYDPTTEYSPLDLVYYSTDNSTYLCVEGCTGETPSPSSQYWQLVVDGSSVATPDFDDLGDVDMTGVQNGQVPTYNSTTQKYEPGNGGGGGMLPHVIVITETGSTVTLTKDLNVITATETSTGHFEADVDEYGTWTIDSILSGDDAQTTINIDAVKVYTITDAHFSASITVAYPSGGTCTLSATGQTTQAATGSPYTFTVHEATTYTLTATNRGASKTATVTITTTGQTETYSFLVDGATVLTTDDVEIWLDCACLWDKAYTTEAEIIADSEALLALISDNNAVDYMARSTSFRTQICADALAMLYIGQYNYCADALLADNTWFSAICESEHVGLVVEPIIPKMTGNSTPSGVASGSATYTGFDYYFAFDGIETDAQRWTSGAAGTQWVQYKCAAAKKINAIRLNAFVYNGVSCAQNCKLLASNDGSTYVELTAFTTTGTAHIKALTFANSTAYQYYKVECSNDDANWLGIVEIQLYNREDASAPSHELKTFATANEAEILEMVCKADRGEIDLYDDAGWRVGQEHNTSISAIPASGSGYTVGEAQAAQTATLVLMHKGLYELNTSVLNKDGTARNTCSFVVGVKNSLGASGYINSTNTNTGSWNASARRNWCNNGFRESLPSVIRSAFKRFKCVTGDYNGTQTGGTNITSIDYFAFPAAKEVLGVADYSHTNEASALTQFSWYENSVNRKKTIGDSGSNSGWWTRSPSYNLSTQFCRLTGAGDGASSVASDTVGLSPFGCL